jgi:casein kinase 1
MCCCTLCKGFCPGRESGYALCYMKANNKLEKYQKIMEKKMSIPVEIQCRGLPIEFSMYLNYCRSLKFEDKPDYTFLRRLFRELMEREGYKMDFDYDWCNLEEERVIESSKVKIELKKPVNVNSVS